MLVLFSPCAPHAFTYSLPLYKDLRKTVTMDSLAQMRFFLTPSEKMGSVKYHFIVPTA